MKTYRAEFPEHARELDGCLDGKGVATRVTSGKILNLIATRVSSLFGGSADLNPSTNTELKGLGNFEHPARNAGVMGVDEYGASAPGPVVMREYGFTPECVVERVEALLK